MLHHGQLNGDWQVRGGLAGLKGNVADKMVLMLFQQKKTIDNEDGSCARDANPTRRPSRGHFLNLLCRHDASFNLNRKEQAALSIIHFTGIGHSRN